MPVIRRIHFQITQLRNHATIVDDVPQFNIEYGSKFRDDLPQVLIVIHEAARTGAPILGLNLVWALREFYNVTVLILDKNGPILKDFISSGAHQICYASVRGNREVAHKIIEKLIMDSKFEFGILNSIESSFHVLPILAKHHIFTINLIHEFTSCYVDKSEIWRFMTDWAGELVFSSKLTMEDALEFAPISARARSSVIPQGNSLLPQIHDDISVDDKTERERLKLLLRPKNNKEKNTLIVGLGSVHLRKGVDLFIQTAAEIIKQDPRGLYRFIWFGKSYETDLNWGYDIFLKDQIRRLNLSKHLLLVADTEHLNIVYEEVDFILLTSRLDPLPNVALDGMSLGIPVFCFENATGIAEYLQSSEQGKNCVSPYLDVKSMASNVVRINLNHKLKESIIHENIEISKKYFDFNAYIKNLCSLKSKEQARYEEELECLKINSNSNIDRKYFLSHEFCKKINIYLPIRFDANDINQVYLYTWRNTHLRRKPIPKFHPGIYSEDNILYRGIDPYAHYLKAGSPVGRWISNCIELTGTDFEVVESNPRSVAIHIHVFYIDVLEEILDRIYHNKIRPDIFITISNAYIYDEVKELILRYSECNVQILIIENRGRNLRALFKEIAPLLYEKYEYVAHFHTKKSPHAEIGLVKSWTNYIFDLLIGGEDTGGAIDRILSELMRVPNVGLVFPADPNIIGWDLNLPFALEIAKDLQINQLREQFNFPVGAMFWIRVSALKVFNSLNEKYFPEEPLQSDGSYLHALERLIPNVMEKEGYEYALVSADGITR